MARPSKRVLAVMDDKEREDALKKVRRAAKKSPVKSKMSKPKTARGKAAVERLGRTKKTGGFAKIAKSASKEYGSKKAGQKVAASIYWKMVKGRKNK